MSGSSDFLVFNPNQNNQESDSAYNGDSNRANGFPSGVGGAGVIVLSLLLNKALNQSSVMAAALGQFGANQGQTMSDASEANLVTALQAFLATLNSPAFTGTPTGPTASANTSDTQLANTAFVAGVIETYRLTGPISGSANENYATLNTNAGGGAAAGRVIRISIGIRCAGAAGSATQLKLTIGSSVTLFPSSGFMEIGGDFCNCVITIPIQSGLSATEAYVGGVNQYNGGVSPMYGVFPLSGINLSSGQSWLVSLSGGSGGTFKLDYFVIEYI
jgi:hypothetical protein